MRGNELVIGIDIGGTNTTFGIIDREGKFYLNKKIKTAEYKQAVKFVDKLSNLIKFEIKKLSGNYEIKGIGIGAPNGNFYNGTIEFAPNMPWKGVIPLVKLFRESFDMPVVLTNDANAAALGEMVYGDAKGMGDFIEITLGTGLGSGIVTNGQLLYGHDGFAGEIGHSIIIQDGRRCGCGRKGCLETYCSATGITRTVIEMLEKQDTTSLLRNYSREQITSKIIFAAACKGDKFAIKAFEFTGKILGLALANSVVYTSPEAIFLFGGLANAGKFIFEPTIKSFEENLLKIFRKKIKILPSGLKESDAAVLGAASLIWQND